MAFLESSDYVSRFYDLNARGIADTLNDLPSSPPSVVAKRLARVSLQWTSLPSLAKRALLWDSGYVKSTPEAYTQVYTQCVNGTGLSMASIAVTITEFADMVVICNTQSAGNVYARQATGDVKNVPIKCAIDAPLASQSLSVWSQDDLGPYTVPALQVFNYHVNDVQLCAIHSTPWTDGTFGTCPKSNHPSGLIVPCVALNSSSNKWCEPAQSPLMNSWLANIENPQITVPTTTYVLTAAPTDTIVAPLALSHVTTNPTVATVVIVLGAAFGVAAVVVGVCFIVWFQRKLQIILHNTESMAVARPPPLEQEVPVEGVYGELVTPRAE
ncbi:hypothetical protein THRCLA_22035 [Thraustotheca clavata]|uniref:Uncharacterized protein n=1 Tax=Thraustotheca clavata TaxID=74557 RepID=A0A1V9ZDJ6_9STRA|nr:hypothetical protein THRCLA_22035 [Thraustotheca clavata]